MHRFYFQIMYEINEIQKNNIYDDLVTYKKKSFKKMDLEEFHYD